MALGLLAMPSLAVPTGKIGFLGPQGAQIWNLSNGKTQLIRGSKKATVFAFSPRAKGVLLIPNGRKSKQNEPLMDGFLIRAPYTKNVAVPSLRNLTAYSYLWSRSGNSLYLSDYQSNGVFTPATGDYSRLAFLPESFDLSGQKVGYATETEVRIHDLRTNKDRILFSVNKPQPLFAAIKRAKYPKKISEVINGQSDDLWQKPINWQITAPAIAPDGSRAYFASNAGTGYGAAGNGTLGLFSYNLKTGVLSIMSKVGTQFGRPPELRLSPDGKRLLIVSSVHSSAIDNSSYALVIDLLTQNTRELLYQMPGAKNKANIFGGAAWSPDSKYLAISSNFYDSEKMMNQPDGNWPEPTAKDYKTTIFYAGTGEIWEDQKRNDGARLGALMVTQTVFATFSRHSCGGVPKKPSLLVFGPVLVFEPVST